MKPRYVFWIIIALIVSIYFFGILTFKIVVCIVFGFTIAIWLFLNLYLGVVREIEEETTLSKSTRKVNIWQDTTPFEEIDFVDAKWVLYICPIYWLAKFNIYIDKIFGK